jgi:alkylated DNA repair dioxygenase AlkB
VQFLIGTSNYQKQQQLLMNNDDRYYRIVKAATTLTNNNNNNNDNNNNNNNKIKDINDFCTSCDVIKEIVSITDFSNINGTNRERILNDLSEFIDKLLNFVSIRIKDINPIYIDRLDWALTRLYNYTNESRIKDYLEKINSKRQSFKLPFSVLQNIVSNSTTFEKLLNEVPFQAEKLFTRDGKSVQERRETCWMAEKGIDGLAYSGKIMIPVPFCESVKSVRDAVEQKTGHFFDCCLINYYPDGDSACKFHSDPDMGTLWAKETVVVSFGETRRFHFRSIGDKTENDQLHFTYRLFQGSSHNIFIVVIIIIIIIIKVTLCICSKNVKMNINTLL